jgi:glutathione S-transferase
MTGLRLYDYPASANCYKARLVLAQLDIECERVPVDIFEGDTLTDEYALLNPHRSTPVLELADGRTLVESNAILWYLAAGTPLLPDDPFVQAEVCRWLIYEQSDVMFMIGGLRFRLITGRWTPNDAEAQRRHSGAHEALSILDRHLAAQPFLVGDRYSIADLAVFAYAHVAEEAGVDTSRYSSVRAWLERVRAQPGFVDNLEPYPPNAAVLAGKSIYG